jgi:hypothetical protein
MLVYSVISLFNVQSVSNIFVPGSGGYVACPRSAAGSRVGWHKDVWNALYMNEYVVELSAETVAEDGKCLCLRFRQFVFVCVFEIIQNNVRLFINTGRRS